MRGILFSVRAGIIALPETAFRMSQRLPELRGTSSACGRSSDRKRAVLCGSPQHLNRCSPMLEVNSRNSGSSRLVQEVIRQQTLKMREIPPVAGPFPSRFARYEVRRLQMKHLFFALLLLFPVAAFGQHGHA